ncbi:MAG: TIR domain-containing protein [Sphingomicrobium sp.]
MADVFISYARDDERTARRVARALQAAGFDLWWDADLPAHRAYSEIIERNLNDAKAVVVLWSTTAARSQWVRAEADVARNQHKLVQAALDGSVPPLPFNQIQCASLKGWRGAASHGGWSKLQASVQSLVSGEDESPTEARKDGLSEQLRRYRWSIVAALALVVAAAALFIFLSPAAEERKPVIAVLPFRSLDAQNQGLVAGIWEDTRQAIGRNPQLIVLGPNTAEQLAQKGEGAARKAADYLLEASVRAAGDRIRVTTGLVRTRDGAQLWSEDFDRKLDDVFAIQSEIAREIEGRIRGRLAKKGGVMPEHIATSGDVYALYVDARAKLRKRDTNLYPAATEQLQQVVKIDANFAPGWATLALARRMLLPSQKGFTADDPSEGYARKAIELAPNLAAGHAALAFALNLEGPMARAELDRAVALDPNDYESLNWLAGMLKGNGQSREAIAVYNRALRIEPLFWPVVLNLYEMLKENGDKQGIQKLLQYEQSVGGDYFAAVIDMNRASDRGEVAKAANIGLALWNTRRPEAQTLAGDGLWPILLQLGYDDIVWSRKVGPAPPFAPHLWRNEPESLDMIEALHMPAKTLMSITPLVQNAGRVYLLNDRSEKFADDYLSLGLSPEQYAELFDDPEDFLSTVPVVALALQRNGHGSTAKPLLALAERHGVEFARTATTSRASAWLARIYAVEGRKDEAVAQLSSAVSRRWLPLAPIMMADISMDPPLAMLKGDPKFEGLRQQVFGTLARERSQVDQRLLAQLKSA